MRKFILLFVLAIMVCGCVRVNSEFGSFTSIKYPAKGENEEVMLLTSVPNRPYKEIGIIRVEATKAATLEKINFQILKKAKEVGADAVINIYYSGGETMGGIVGGTSGSNVITIVSKKHAQGTAIIFTDK